MKDGLTMRWTEGRNSPRQTSKICAVLNLQLSIIFQSAHSSAVIFYFSFQVKTSPTPSPNIQKLKKINTITNNPPTGQPGPDSHRKANSKHILFSNPARNERISKISFPMILIMGRSTWSGDLHSFSQAGSCWQAH